METIRPPAVAGLFYPDDAEVLRQEIRQFLAQTRDTGAQAKALIVPHAGYRFSGQCAAHAYAQVAEQASNIHRVVLLGPSHRVGFRGIAMPDCDFFLTPLGRIPIDQQAIDEIRHLNGVQTLPQAHAQEHSLEVQLPFLQQLLPDFSLVPLVVGDAPAEQVAAVLEQLWGGDETLIVISTDLSHYHPYECAQVIDAATCQEIEALNPVLMGEQACGCRPLNGLLTIARNKRLQIEPIYRCNSGDTGGDKGSVVGYASYALH